MYTAIFFIVATLYSSVGFGGGSSYIALMFLYDVPYQFIPKIALICNLIVVSGGAYHFIRNKHTNWNFLFPFILTSIPSSFFGGALRLNQSNFKILLGACLLLAGLKMLFSFKKEYSDINQPSFIKSSFLGLVIGFISGLVGIGGGIFLSPILYYLKWAPPKQIACLCCLFIFFNSIAGLLGQISKEGSFTFIQDYWQLLIAVFIGGQIGSFLGATKLKPRYIEITTSILVISVATRILFFS